MTQPRRTLFVTVGTTVLTAKNLGGYAPDAASLREEARRYLETKSARPEFEKRLLEAHQAIWEHGLTIRDHRFWTSAEVASSYYALRVQVDETLGGGGKELRLFTPGEDRIVLLASDTEECHLCARVNQEIIRRHLFAEAAGQDSVVLEVVKGLEAKRHGFNVVPVLSEIWNRHLGKEETIVNITGGFKGLAPTLAWLCNQQQMTAGGCWMFYAYEDMDCVEILQFAPAGPPLGKTTPVLR